MITLLYPMYNILNNPDSSIPGIASDVRDCNRETLPSDQDTALPSVDPSIALATSTTQVGITFKHHT
jgi:hypothetical protein